MQKYLPEGSAAPILWKNAEDILEKAQMEQTILEATAIRCEENHDLILDLGETHGVIRRKDAAMGVAEGETREIAILSRVGKPCAFCVLGRGSDGMWRLSRRIAQEKALEWMLHFLQPGEILAATVTHTAQFGAFCDIGCGVTALCGLDAISVSRAAHSAERFAAGDRVYVVVKSVHAEERRIYLSHRELLGTWEENAAQFREGQTVTGIVRSVREYGAFIELAPNLSGLADPNPALCPGDAVSVYIKSIQPDRGKIKLIAIAKLDRESLPRMPMRYFVTSGRLRRWDYGPAGKTKTASVF